MSSSACVMANHASGWRDQLVQAALMRSRSVAEARPRPVASVANVELTVRAAQISPHHAHWAGVA